MDFNDKVVWVTGGAQGIGKGLARSCLKRGARVIISNLDEQVAMATVSELSPLGEIRAVRSDVTDAEASAALLDDIWRREGGVDWLFCNAGAGGMKPLQETSVEEMHSQFVLNTFAPMIQAQQLVARLTADQRTAHIMFTGSENSLVLPPGNADLAMGVYGGTKHALLIMAEWLRYELRNSNIGVSVLLPGPVLTERLAATFTALEHAPADDPLRQTIPPAAEQTLRERFITPDTCAEIAMQGLELGLFYIPTQAYIKTDLDTRYAEIAAAFDALGLSP